MIVPLDQIPNSTGYLVLSLEGAILVSGGDLENSEKVAKKILDVLTAASTLVTISGTTDPIQTVSITFGTHAYVVAKSNKRIHIVKKKIEHVPTSITSNATSIN